MKKWQDFSEFIDAEFGALDVLVNNAGVGVFRSVSDLTVEDWQLTSGDKSLRRVLLLP